MDRHSQAFPLPEAKAGLLVEKVGAEMVVFDPEAGKAHCLRPLAAAVFAHADGKTSLEDVRRAVAADMGEATSLDDIEDALAELTAGGLLKTPLVTPSTDQVSRRAMLRRTAVAGGAALSAPLVISAVAATPAFASTACNAGSPCTKDSDCCVGGNCHPNVSPFGAVTCSCSPCPSPTDQHCVYHSPSSGQVGCPT